MLHVRRAVAADVAAMRHLALEIQALHVAARPDLFVPGGAECEADLRARLDAPGELHLVALDDDRVVGYAFAREVVEPRSRIKQASHVLSLEQIGVAEVARGAGVGTALWNALRAEAERLGARQVVLNVYAFNTEAVRFYERLGFAPASQRMALDLHRAPSAHPTRPMTLRRPPLERVLETALYVDDLARARAFYADVLGAPVLLDTERLVALDVGGRSVLLLFRRGGTLEPMPMEGGVVPPHGATGAQHVAFAVPAADLPRWREALAARGVGIESEVTWPRGGRSVYVRDPDGHSVELVTPGLWATY